MSPKAALRTLRCHRVDIGVQRDNIMAPNSTMSYNNSQRKWSRPMKLNFVGKFFFLANRWSWNCFDQLLESQFRSENIVRYPFWFYSFRINIKQIHLALVPSSGTINWIICWIGKYIIIHSLKLQVHYEIPCGFVPPGLSIKLALFGRKFKHTHRKTRKLAEITRNSEAKRVFAT